MPHWINQPWQRNLSKSASGKPGAVQSGVGMERERIKRRTIQHRRLTHQQNAA
jgi:hypothetical protein